MQNEEQDRRQLYQLIVRQLEDDGYHGAATAVSNATLAPSNSSLPPNRLQTLVAIGLTLEKDRVPGASFETYSSDLGTGMIDLSALKAIKGVDFDMELQEPVSKRPYPNYQTRFITTHKNSVRCAKFSPDGKVIATGSADTSIKLLDVQKMVNYSQSKSEGGDDFQGARPVLRTLYDHTQAINDIDFHPTLPLLASASRDNTIKFYDYHSSMKKSFKYLQDSNNIRSISFHPSGDYIVAGTDNPLIRLYDINTLQCYVSPNGESNHLGPINQIRYGHDGKLFASCSKDGQIKLWDTVSFRCVQTFSNAHGGLEVNSVQFSKNGKYLLTCGKDASVKLWDLATARQLTRIMTGSAQHNQIQKIRLQTCFSFNEDWIFSAEENSSTVTVWDTRGAEQVQKLTGHAQVVRWVAASPVDPFIMTCSDDHRARFWVEETTMKK